MLENDYDKIDDYETLEYFRRLNADRGLETKTMASLFDEVYAPKTAIVEDLLYSGTYLFAGAPKIGKSFFVAQLAYHVSGGTELWGHKVNKSTVLYLALEDDYARLQHRLYMMFGESENKRLHLSIQANQMNEGLDEQLNSFIEKYNDTRLIIIDTLQRIRELSRDMYSYGSDYDIVARLKRFSDKHNICLLLVHHTRKQQADDCFETISGTNGLLGAADGAFLLHKEKRIASKAMLDIVGRDQLDQRLHLEFNREHCLWELLKTENEPWKPPKDQVLEAVSDVLGENTAEWSGTATELAAAARLDMPPNSLTRHLNVNADRLLNEYNIAYRSSRTRESRRVSLARVSGIGDDA